MLHYALRLSAKIEPIREAAVPCVARMLAVAFSPGYQRNPVTILTGKELFGQYKMGDFYGEYGQDERRIRRHFEDGDLQALGEFTQGLYLDMKPAHEVRQDKRVKMAREEEGENGRDEMNHGRARLLREV